ncbi:hypothetical protein F4821DRAFT_281741 [Hypoxylon rubiginosum]|uniref:Uncharacterized protein n=1 Tax=Hypoxylon rubiginosum TaxID=110542 RepID=A0ACC0CQ21_9PEZI|nr:hypothetical protein F4821DRAFT_281741 [Hypoxylon rubiginosum]
MCIHVFIHHTTREHDTRLLSTLNPVTGYTVNSPFQDPFVTSPPCDYPHILGPLLPEEVCSWHPRCCRLEQQILCKTDGKFCRLKLRVRYHHFYFAGEAAEQNLSFLEPYLNGEAHSLLLIGWFFKAGVELCLANIYRDKKLLDFNTTDEKDLSQIYRTQYLCASNLVLYATNRLNQFALQWDTELGAFLSRPGALLDTFQNSLYSQSLGLRLDSLTHLDSYRESVVFQFDKLPRFQSVTAESFLYEQLPFGNDPSSVSDFSFSLSVAPTQGLLARHGSEGSEDKEDTEGSEDKEGAEDSEESEDGGDDTIYAIEGIVDHRPRGVIERSRIRSYKIRWQGDWPRNQKQTWQRARDTPDLYIDQYFANGRHKAKSVKRRQE